MTFTFATSPFCEDESLLIDTPAGKQPYSDFWFDNTWVPTAQYNGTLYGQYGEWVVDVGFGTYEASDFHHNGDLMDYFDPWEINYGKIYGVMDDLRLEHQRVQQKYIAMTKALIESCDVDGFRVDWDLFASGRHGAFFEYNITNGRT